jgi:hypothetical protein
VSEVQNQQQGDQQQPQEVVDQAQNAAGQATQQVQDSAGQVTDQAGRVTEGVQDAVGGIAGGQQEGREEDGDEQGEGGPLGGVTDQAQDVAGQATGQVMGQAQDAVGGLLGDGHDAGQSGEQAMDDYSYSDSDATTVENDKTPKGILGQLLNLDILPPPQSDTTTLESGDTDEYDGPEGPQHEETQG